MGVDPALIQEFSTLSSYEKLLAGVAVVTVVSIGIEKYFFGLPAPVFDCFGESNSDQFVHDNQLATRYHEIGHAMIDQLERRFWDKKKMRQTSPPCFDRCTV